MKTLRLQIINKRYICSLWLIKAKITIYQFNSLALGFYFWLEFLERNFEFLVGYKTETKEVVIYDKFYGTHTAFWSSKETQISKISTIWTDMTRMFEISLWCTDHFTSEFSACWRSCTICAHERWTAWQIASEISNYFCWIKKSGFTASGRAFP